MLALTTASISFSTSIYITYYTRKLYVFPYTATPLLSLSVVVGRGTGTPAMLELYVCYFPASISVPEPIPAALVRGQKYYGSPLLLLR